MTHARLKLQRKTTLTNTNASLREKQEAPTNLAAAPFSSVLCLKQKKFYLLLLPAERQKKTVNPMLKGFGSSCGVEE
jgi:hypothetical protein